MESKTLRHFLTSNLWYDQCQIHYRGRYYWLEGYFDKEDGMEHFDVYGYPCFKDEEGYCHGFAQKDGSVKGFEYLLRLKRKADSIFDLQPDFLRAPIFGGRTFMEAKDEIEFVEWGKPIPEKGE